MKIAIVGTGVMGRNHIRVIKEIRGANLVAICDIDEECGKKLAQDANTKYYKTHIELLENEKIDAAIISTPTSSHKEIALDLINRKIHLLIEKPLASDSNSASEIVYKARKKGITLSVGHIERYNPAVNKIINLIKNDKLGEINSIVIKRVGVYPPRVKDVNVVIDLAVHDLDIVSSIIKRPPFYIMATGGGSHLRSREDHAEIFLDYGDMGCFIQVNWITPIKIRSLSVTGTKGYAELNYVTQELDLYQTDYLIKEPKSYREFVIETGKPKKYQIKIIKKEPLRLELENFIKSVQGKEKPTVTGEDGLAAIRLAEAVLKSIATGEKVQPF